MRISYTALLSIGLLSPLAHRAALVAQSCATRTGVFYDFQVDRHAVFVGDTATHPRPFDEPPPVPAGRIATVQFIVDSAGSVVPASIKLLSRVDSADARRVEERSRTWTFHPAFSKGCRVAQLVQTRVVLGAPE